MSKTEKEIVSLSDVEHIAKLSRLKFNDKEKENFKQSLNEILKHIKAIENTDTTNSGDSRNSYPLTGLREDVVRPSLSQKEILKNAPFKNDSAFIVPKVVE